ncbi:hypothetical protein [Rhizobium skierniewicense]|uniref:hypothetical protein n=1 Tax=Rhizobium skierniewicense TaxID=984260 RepID=UPI0015741780|nr:hypothetical protein [Rhizobium skierniewicense]NTF34792.1 hypothetical protein [Rhizobium skierniewicense]
MIDDWKREVRSKLEELVDGLVVNGVSYEDACSVIVVEVNSMLVAHEHDPDPTDDDVIEEPANDWPAAEDKRPAD